jgi:hypothetical protein
MLTAKLDQLTHADLRILSRSILQLNSPQCVYAEILRLSCWRRISIVFD